MTIDDLNNVANPLNSFSINRPVFTIRANHTGDIYHAKAARAIAGVENTDILIWGVNTENTKLADKACEMAEYFGKEPNKPYYTSD